MCLRDEGRVLRTAEAAAETHALHTLLCRCNAKDEKRTGHGHKPPAHRTEEDEAEGSYRHVDYLLLFLLQ